MYDLPGNNPLSNAPVNMVTGKFIYPGQWTLSNNFDTEHSFAVPLGVQIIWVTLIGAGGNTNNVTQDTYFGSSTNPYFKIPGFAAAPAAPIAPAGIFASLGFPGQIGTSAAPFTGGSTPLGMGAREAGAARNTGWGYGGTDAATVAYPSSGWFYEVPLFVSSGQVIPFQVSAMLGNSGNLGGAGYLKVEW